MIYLIPVKKDRKELRNEAKKLRSENFVVVNFSTLRSTIGSSRDPERSVESSFPRLQRSSDGSKSNQATFSGVQKRITWSPLQSLRFAKVL